MMTPAILSEIDSITSDRFKLGEYIYMAMAKHGEQRVCIAVAYKIDYCIKKALQFVEAEEKLIFTHINKVKIGELIRCEKFDWITQQDLQLS